MVVIRGAQMQALRDVMLTRWHRQIVDHLHRHFPVECAQHDGPLDDVADWVLFLARQHGVAELSAILKLAAVVLLYEEEDWIDAYLPP
jgi:hypothetical protein